MDKLKDRKFFQEQYFERVGETRINNLGSLMIIDEYNNSKDVWVRFVEHGDMINTTYGAFIRGNVKSAYDISVFNAGYIGDGSYKVSTKDGNKTPQYKSWVGMMKRCFSEKTHFKYPTYSNCKIAPEWLNFQTFSKWFDENYYEVNDEMMCLDKDILVKGNKLYSPDTCIFVPSYINALFIKSNANRGKYPIGVKLDKRSGKFEAQCKGTDGKNKHLGTYTSVEDTFQSYKIFKETLIKNVAEKYKDLIPNKLYKAMLAYEVEIND